MTPPRQHYDIPDTTTTPVAAAEDASPSVSCDGVLRADSLGRPGRATVQQGDVLLGEGMLPIYSTLLLWEGTVTCVRQFYCLTTEHCFTGSK